MKQFTFSNVYAYTYTHIITINGKRGHAFDKEKGGYIDEFGERKGKERERKGEMCNYTIISKIKYILFNSKYSFFQAISLIHDLF